MKKAAKQQNQDQAGFQRSPYRAETQGPGSSGKIEGETSPSPGPPAKKLKAMQASVERPKNGDEEKRKEQLDADRKKESCRGIEHGKLARRILRLLLPGSENPESAGLPKFNLFGRFPYAGSGNGHGEEQSQNGIAGMAMTKGSVREVEGHGKDEWKRCDGEEIAALSTIETNQPSDHCHKDNGVPEEQTSGEQRVRVEKVPPGRFRAQPCSDDPASTKSGVKRGVSGNEGFGSLPFVFEEGVFTETRVKMDLLVASDAIHFARVFVKDFVVSGPELVCEVGAQRDKTMKLEVIADCPWEASHKERRGSDQQ